MSLRDSAIKGVAWSSLGTIGGGVINFILIMVLARLLTPADFGLLALLVVFSVISETFVNSGFSQAIIRDSKATFADLSSAFFFNLIIAFAVYGILFFASVLIAQFYEEPKLVWLSRFAFLSVIFNGLSIVPNAVFSRQLNFKPQAIATVLAVVVSGLVSVIFAFSGFGVWALAINMVLFSFVRALLLWIQSKWFPGLIMSATSIKKYFRFGGNLLIQGLVDKIVTNVEQLIIGRIYTKIDLGFYSQSKKLDNYLIKTASNVIQTVTYPLLAKIGDDQKRLKEGYRKVLGVNMIWTIPFSFFIFAASENIISTLYGLQWLPAASYFRIWAVISLLVSIYSVFLNVFLVKGESGKLLKLSLFRQAIRIFSIIMLIRISIMYMLLGVLSVTLISCIMYIYQGGRLINYSLTEIFADIWPIIYSATVSSACAFIIGSLVHNLHFVLAFIVQSITMFAFYLFFISWLKNEFFLELKGLLLSYTKRFNK